jgi:hypothetical protein
MGVQSREVSKLLCELLGISEATIAFLLAIQYFSSLLWLDIATFATFDGSSTMSVDMRSAAV